MLRDTLAEAKRGNRAVDTRATAMAYIPGSWDTFAARVKASWKNLTDIDLYPTRGRPDALIDLIEERSGQDRQTIARRLAEIERECGTLAPVPPSSDTP